MKKEHFDASLQLYSSHHTKKPSLFASWYCGSRTRMGANNTRGLFPYEQCQNHVVGTHPSYGPFNCLEYPKLSRTDQIFQNTQINQLICCRF